jgi:hypothetical protein
MPSSRTEAFSDGTFALIDAFYIFNQIELTGAPDELDVEVS